MNPSANLNVSLCVTDSEAVLNNSITLLNRLYGKLMSLRNILKHCHTAACDINCCALGNRLKCNSYVIIFVNFNKILHGLPPKLFYKVIYNSSHASVAYIVDVACNSVNKTINLRQILTAEELGIAEVSLCELLGRLS